MPRLVLVVDDEPLVLDVTAAMLEDLGCEVITAASGNDALHKLSMNGRIEILITDINMPGMHGYELAEKAKRMRATKGARSRRKQTKTMKSALRSAEVTDAELAQGMIARMFAGESDIAIQFTGAVGPQVIIPDSASGSQNLVSRANVDVPIWVEFKVAPGKSAIVVLAEVPHRDVRRNLFANDPRKELPGTVGQICSETFGFETHAFTGSIDHRLRGNDLIVGSRRRRP